RKKGDQRADHSTDHRTSKSSIAQYILPTLSSNKEIQKPNPTPILFHALTPLSIKKIIHGFARVSCYITSLLFLFFFFVFFVHISPFMIGP
ncbi:hypothetical protein OFM39_28445, partial [Escherichia coli]|nr:hypothetical protein [Escherichia coli]